MKKKLLFLILLMVLIPLTSCDTSTILLYNHEFNPSYDSEYHFDLCECGETINKEEHSFKEEIIKEATCSEVGQIKHYCDCGYFEMEEIPVVEHEYNEWDTSIEATCISNGQLKRTCKNCGHEEYKETNKAAHTPTAHTDLAADCTHEGHTGGTYCSVCREELSAQTIIDKKDHSYGEWTIVDEPSCTSIGSAERECEVCGHKDYKTLEKTPHTPIAYTDLEANCQHEGHIGGTYCSVCNQELTPYTTISKTGHDYTEWEIDTPATCISQGKEKRECKFCHLEEYRDVEKAAHTPVPGEAKASTCIGHGHSEGSYCSFCGIELVAPEELPFGDHNYSIETVTKNPTLNSEGVLKHTCSVCGDSYTTSINKLDLTQQIWINSLTATKFKNKYMQVYYEDNILNKKYDITIMNKDNIQKVEIYDYHTGKIYEYYYNGTEVIESCVDGYRHRAYDELTDPYIRYLELTVLNSIYYSSYSYDKVTWQGEPENYFIAQHIELKNLNGDKEEGTIAIQIDDNLNLTMYAYSSSNYMINIQEIGTSPNITIPNATHHHIVNGKCDRCNNTYTAYSTTKNNIELYYYVNNNTNELEFDYDLVYSNQDDVTFLTPTYYKNGKLKRFTSLYYEGTNPYYSKQVKSFTINSNKLLKITYTDYSVERIILLSDNTAISVSYDSDYAYNPYAGNLIGQSFDLVLPNNKIRRYKIVSDTEIQITEYNEINYYIINDIEITDFNRNLESILGKTCMSDNGNGIKPDGNNDYIYFVLSSSLSLDITYTYINGTKAFNTITFKNITGYYINGKKDIYIYFMGDNNNYVLHYNDNIEITKI